MRAMSGGSCHCHERKAKGRCGGDSGRGGYSVGFMLLVLIIIPHVERMEFTLPCCRIICLQPEPARIS